MVKAAASLILDLINRAMEDQRVRKLPEQELLQRFHAQQDEAAFHVLLRRHGPMVLDVCRGVLGNEADAEDAFQATFLILARKVGSIRKMSSLGSWLHGVAYRTALKSRAQSATRQKHEARVPQRQASEPDDLSWREVRQTLHEELSGLPERYRAPLVLCYLEGATQDAAAVQLQLAKSTLRERLERGRTLLRTRLLRRGLGLTALLVAGAWPATTASAGLPIAVVSSTIKAATLLAARQAAATSVISAKVTALTEAMLKTMFLTKLKIATALLVVVPLLVGASAIGYHTQVAEQLQAPKKAEKTDKPQPNKDNCQGACVLLPLENAGKEVAKEAVQAESRTFKGQEDPVLEFGKNSDGMSRRDLMKKPDKIDSTTTAAQAPQDSNVSGNKGLPPGLAKKAANHPGRLAWLKAHG